MNGTEEAFAAPLEEIHRKGPWPFVTYRRFRLPDEHFVWRSRRHRKGLVRLPDQRSSPFWHRPAYNWWTGLSFAIGASLFMLGSLLSLVPNSLESLQINLIFFAGSIPFTIAGYLQHFQSANTAEFTGRAPPAAPDQAIRFIGWQPANAGWWCTLTQFVGTVAFNFNTFDAIHAPAAWYAQDLVIWVPGMIGSVLFLISGYLAYIEAGHAHWSFKPLEMEWWIVFINLLGCIAFMIASTIAFIPKGAEPVWIGQVSNANLFTGAFCFFTGAVLLMIEARMDWEKTAHLSFSSGQAAQSGGVSLS
jgi:hypothetical protein